MPLRITTIDGKRTVVCEPILPAIGVLPPQKWRPSRHAALLQTALLRAADRAIDNAAGGAARRSTDRAGDNAPVKAARAAGSNATGSARGYWGTDTVSATARG
jgi:hypothetical protein